MDTKATTFATLSELLEWCRRAPAGTSLDARELAAILATVGPESHQERDEAPAPAPPGGQESSSWRERLWTVPSETRLGMAEVTEALGRPKSFVYSHTSATAEDRIPHRKMDGSLFFTAGELRAWIRAHEVEVIGGPMEPPARTLRALS